jgi:hypothetical protein
MNIWKKRIGKGREEDCMGRREEKEEMVEDIGRGGRGLKRRV